MILICEFLLFELLFAVTAAFTKAPGNITITIKMTEHIDICDSKECHYHLEFCVGSGRSDLERCIWFPSKTFSGRYSENQAFLAKQSFEADDVRSSFYFNSNLTFRNNNDSKIIRFKDGLIKYDAHSGTSTTTLYSDAFVSMVIDIDVTCKSGFYPPFQCTRSCFGVSSISDCDANGNIVCLTEYVYHNSTGKCIKDMCKLSVNICKNNSTCVNDISTITCLCTQDYSGQLCDVWDPCLRHQCHNSGTCVPRTLSRDYLCRCADNYDGKFCDRVIDPCKDTLCPHDTVCQLRGNYTVCKTVNKPPETGVVHAGWFPEKEQRPYTETSVTKNSKSVNNNEETEMKNRDTVKLIQYPIQKDFTTIFLIVVLLVFVVCCFGVTFWMQRYKYFQKRKKYSSYPNITNMPSIIPIPTYRSAEDNFKRWHSLDDSSFYLCHQPNHEQFSTMSYKSGSNLWPRYDLNHDSYRNWPHTLKPTMPRMNESSTFQSDDLVGDLCDSVQNNLETMDDFVHDGAVPMSVSSYN